MKILYLIHQFYPEYYTGTEKFVLNLSRMMQKSGNKVKIFTYSFREDSFYDRAHGGILLKEFIYKGIPVLAFRHKKIPETIHHALEDKELASIAHDLINGEKPDVVHVGHPKNISELVKALTPLKIPYILTLTDFFLMCPKYILVTSRNTLCNGPQEGKACQNLCPEFRNNFILKRLENAREILFHAKVVVSPSTFLAGLFEKEFDSLSVEVINFGLPYSVIERNQKNYSMGHRIVFCYTGSLNRHKGVHILIDAFKKVRSSEALLRIYGSGPDGSYITELEALAREDQRIEFCGVYSEDKVGEILANIDVVIVPSLWHENTPMVVREALACNVPVIVSNAGGMVEDIEENINGLSFRMGDSKQLAEILQRIVDEPPLLNKLKINLNGRMIPSVEQEAFQYGRLYQRVIAHQVD